MWWRRPPAMRGAPTPSWPPQTAIDLTAGLVAAAGLRRWVLDSRYVGSPSMAPTFEPGDSFLMDKVSLRRRAPSRGEVICFRAPPALLKIYPRDGCFLKRVVAVGGDVVCVRKGVLYVNHEQQQEAYLVEKMKYSLPPTPVPLNHVYVLGDNRNDSRDSHEWGPLAVKLVTGRPLCTYWPPNRACWTKGYAAIRAPKPLIRLRLPPSSRLAPSFARLQRLGTQKQEVVSRAR